MGKHKNITIAVILAVAGLVNLVDFGRRAIAAEYNGDMFMRVAFGVLFTGLAVTYFRRSRRGDDAA